MKQKIQLMAKKITAIVCAIAMFVTGLYAVDRTGSDVQAAYTEISISSTNRPFEKNGKILNITGVSGITDCTAEGSSFLTEEFASEWMTFGGGLTYNELVTGLRKAVVATNNIIQFNWNHNTSPRTEGFIAGTSFTIKQGAPLPYNGASAYVQLDAEYTFTFQAPTDSTTQYNTVVITKQKTRTVSLGGNTQIPYSAQGNNFNFDSTNTTSDATSGDYYIVDYNNNTLDESYEEYIDFAGISLAELKDTYQMRIKFTPTAKCIQIVSWGTVSDKLQVGDSIVFHKGMPVKYKNASGEDIVAYLDNSYEYRCTSVSEGHPEIFKLYVLGEYGLSGQTYVSTSDTDKYVDFMCETDSFSDTTAEIQIRYDDPEIMKNYFEVSGKSYDDLVANGYVLRAYRLSDTFKRLRFSYSTLGLNDGDTVLFKKGFPVNYTTTAGKTRVDVLDKDYGYVYDADTNTFTYDPTIVSEEKVYFQLKSSTNSFTDQDANYKTNITYTDAAVPIDKNYTDILANEETAAYIDFMGIDATTLTQQGVQIKFIPSATTLQINWGSTYDWVADGETITFKQGMPIYYTDTKVMTLKEEVTYLITKINSGLQVRAVAQGATYSIETKEFGDGTESGLTYNLRLANHPFADASGTFQTVLDSTVVGKYIDYCGLSIAEIQSYGVEFTMYNAGDGASRFQISWGTYPKKVGDCIIFKEGMPFSYTLTDGSVKTITLDKTYTFLVGAGNGENQHIISLTDAKFGGTWGLVAGKDYATGTHDTKGKYNNITLSADTFKSFTNTPGAWYLPTETVEDYVDFAGLNESEYDVQVKIDTVANPAILQMFWGTAGNVVKERDTIVFKKGMPIIYTGADGLQYVDTLDADYTFVIKNTTDYGITAMKADKIYDYEDYLQPIWKGNAVYDESVLPLKNQDGSLDAISLAYKADTIFSVKSTDLETTYVEGTDYKLEDGKLVILPNGNIPVMDYNTYYPSSSDVECTNGGYLYCNEIGELHKAQIVVSYTHSDSWSGSTPKQQGNKLSNVIAKLEKQEEVNIVFYGDSITVGANASSFLYLEPRLETWPELVVKSLQDTYAYEDIHYINTAEGSRNSVWGAENASAKVANQNPDLLVLAFGMNDVTTSVESYKANIQSIIDTARGANPSCDIILVATMMPNEEAKGFYGNQEQFLEALKEIAAVDEHIAVSDMTTMHKSLLTNKSYGDMTGNNVNHPNDFLTRVYAQVVLETMKQADAETAGDMDEDKLFNENDTQLTRLALINLIDTATEISDGNVDGFFNAGDLVHAKKAEAQKASTDKYEETYKQVYCNNTKGSTISAGESVTYTLNQALEGKAYVRLTFTTTEDLAGTFVYTDNTGVTYTEEFYVEEEEVQFEQFLDNFRKNGLTGSGKTMATLQSITLKNLGTVSATVRLHSVEIADRTINMNSPFVYVKNDYLKIGMDLLSGGSLLYMAYVNTEEGTLQETTSGLSRDLEINLGGSGSTSEINLINLYDRGRGIQQAYYADIDSTNGYENEDYDKLVQDGDGEGYDWPYNPVQAGDEYNNSSQIVDYRVTENFLYVKTRAMDWAKDNVTTKSYMETWYVLKDKLLFVDNRFIDWSGWTGMSGVINNELPASFVAQSFDKFVTYDGNSPWTGGSLYSESGIENDDVNRYRNYNPSEGWYAWVNDDNFGIGMYVPGIHQFSPGRAESSTSTLYSANRGASNAPIFNNASYLNSNLINTWGNNCFLRNMSYTSSVLKTSMDWYEALDYTYVITVDTVTDMREAFKGLAENNEVNNSGINNWD